MRRLLKKLLQVLAVVAAVGALALGLFFASLWFENSQSLELPRPTGPFPVGRVGTTWVDTGRAYPFAPPPDRDRNLRLRCRVGANGVHSINLPAASNLTGLL